MLIRFRKNLGWPAPSPKFSLPHCLNRRFGPFRIASRGLFVLNAEPDLSGKRFFVNRNFLLHGSCQCRKRATGRDTKKSSPQHALGAGALLARRRDLPPAGRRVSGSGAGYCLRRCHPDVLPLCRHAVRSTGRRSPAAVWQSLAVRCSRGARFCLPGLDCPSWSRRPIRGNAGCRGACISGEPSSNRHGAVRSVCFALRNCFAHPPGGNHRRRRSSPEEGRLIVPVNVVLALSAVLFGIGAFGFLARRNIILMLISVEVMLNAVNVSLAGFSRHLGDLRGQVLALFVIAVAAAEVGVGLGLVIALNRNKPGAAVGDLTKLKW